MKREVTELMRLEAATQALVYAHDKAVGQDLGAEAEAICWVEIRNTLKSLREIRGVDFDAKASLDELMLQDKNKR